MLPSTPPQPNPFGSGRAASYVGRTQAKVTPAGVRASPAGPSLPTLSEESETSRRNTVTWTGKWCHSFNMPVNTSPGCREQMLISSTAHSQAAFAPLPLPGVTQRGLILPYPQEGAFLCSEAKSMPHSFFSIPRRTAPGSLTCRGDFAKEAMRCVVAFSQVASLVSSSTRVLGTKLQERPRAGFSAPVLLSFVTWLVTCSTNRLISAREKQCHSV